MTHAFATIIAKWWLMPQPLITDVKTMRECSQVVPPTYPLRLVFWSLKNVGGMDFLVPQKRWGYGFFGPSKYRVSSLKGRLVWLRWDSAPMSPRVFLTICVTLPCCVVCQLLCVSGIFKFSIKFSFGNYKKDFAYSLRLTTTISPMTFYSYEI